MTEPKDISVSIVICTHNRADILDQSLANYTGIEGEINYEILIVLNACTDHTIEIAKKYKSILPNLRYTTEETIGLSFARNKGYQDANGTYVFYTDDDAYPHKEILTGIAECIDRGIDTFTGRTLYWPVHSPEWILPEYVASRHYADRLCILPPGGYINGCVAGFRREALEKVGGFNPKYGMTGKKMAYYEEVLMQNALMDAGYTIYYNPSIQIYHQSHNKTVKDFIRSSYLKGVYRRLAGDSSRLKSFILFILTTVKGMFLFSFLTFTKGWKRAAKESFSLPAIYLGQAI